jgi:predicted small lipoprotein YifL
MKTLNWVVLVGAGLVVAGCGQKGPLFLPDKNASVVTRPAAGTATQPAPAQPDDKKKDEDQSKTAPKN